MPATACTQRRRHLRAPAYYLGRPAGWWITALAAGRRGRSGEAISPPRLPPSTSRNDMSPRRKDAKMTRAWHRHDAIVVGARVAGAATAMLLARQGFDVLLVDRARFPSEIPHGHYVHMHGPPRLAAWGLLDRVLATGTPSTTRPRPVSGKSPRSIVIEVIGGHPVASTRSSSPQAANLGGPCM